MAIITYKWTGGELSHCLTDIPPVHTNAQNNKHYMPCTHTNTCLHHSYLHTCTAIDGVSDPLMDLVSNSILSRSKSIHCRNNSFIERSQRNISNDTVIGFMSKHSRYIVHTLDYYTLLYTTHLLTLVSRHFFLVRA